MTDWLQRYARALETHLDSDGSIEPSDGQSGLLLDLARVVAHGTERKNAPLATFVTGRFVQAVVDKGGDPADAIATALTVAEETVEPSTDPQAG